VFDDTVAVTELLEDAELSTLRMLDPDRLFIA